MQIPLSSRRKRKDPRRRLDLREPTFSLSPQGPQEREAGEPTNYNKQHNKQQSTPVFAGCVTRQFFGQVSRRSPSIETRSWNRPRRLNPPTHSADFSSCCRISANPFSHQHSVEKAMANSLPSACLQFCGVTSLERYSRRAQLERSVEPRRTRHTLRRCTSQQVLCH